MHRQTKKIFSWLLVVCLVLSFGFTSTAFAAETPENQPEPVPVEVEDISAETMTPDDTDGKELTEEVAQPEQATEEPQAQPLAAPLSIESLLSIAERDGANAAELMNTIEDDVTFLDALRQLLDQFYVNGLTAQLEAFTAVIDARAATMLEEYAQAAAQRNATDLGFAAGEVLVTFQAGVAEPQATAAMEVLDGTLDEIVESPASELLAVVEIGIGQTVEQAIAEFSADPAVAHVQPNFIYERVAGLPEPEALVSALPTDPYINNLWHLDKIHVGEAWDLLNRTSGSKVRVAILDDFADITHEDLKGNVNASVCYDVQDVTPKPYPSSGYQNHGTHVAGIVGAVSNNGVGVAGTGTGSSNQVLELAILNVFKDNVAKSSMMIAGVNQAAASGARVINMSLGYKQDNPSTWDTDLENAINNAVAGGAVVVAAAGNGTLDATFFPSDFDNVISVISTTDYANTTDNSKSSGSNYGAKKNISAPGVSIYSTFAGNTYGNNSGTSMAAPVVSGVVAMMLYANPSLTPAQVLSIITTTATDLYTPGFDTQTAWGNVNAYAAVAKALGMTPPETPANFAVQMSSATELTLSWDTVAGVDGYKIYRSSTANGQYQLIETKTTAADTTYTDAVPDAKQMYYYKITAFKGTGASQVESSPAGPKRESLSLPAPTTFNAVKTTGQNSVSLNWSAVTGSSGYNVQRSESQTSGFTTITTTATTSYVDTTVTAGKTYYYRVEAYGTKNGLSVGGVPSVAVSVKVSDNAPVVTGLETESQAYNSVSVSWNAAEGVEGYTVYRSAEATTGFVMVKETQETTFVDTGLNTGKAYYYYVRSYKTEGGVRVESENSETVDAIPVNAMPESLTASPLTYNSIQLKWKKSAGASGYDILRASSETGTYVNVGNTTAANKVTFTDKNRSTGKAYYYKVVPYRNMKAGKVVGDEAGPVVGRASAAAPTGLDAKGQTNTSIKITWNRPAGAKGYYIYRSTTKNGGYKSIKLMASTAAALSYTDKNLESGTKYYYKVIPYVTLENTKVKGRTAGPVVAQTKADRVTNLKATVVDANHIKLSWSKIEGAQGYQLFRSSSENTGFKSVITTLKRSYTDTVSAGANYYYKVRSYKTVNGKRVYGDYSDTIYATTEYEKPNYSAGLPKTANANLTQLAFSITNKGTKDMVLLADTGKLVTNPESTSANDRNLTMYQVVQKDGKNVMEKVIDSITVKAGEQKLFVFTCSPATSYTTSTYLLLDFKYDGHAYRNIQNVVDGPRYAAIS